MPNYFMPRSRCIVSKLERSIIGAVKSNDPKTGIGFDGIKSYIDKAPRSAILSGPTFLRAT